MRFKGTLSDWNDARGFGFILPAEGGARVFVHIKALRQMDTRPGNGMRVTYELGRDEQGRPRAIKVRDSLATGGATDAANTKPHLGLASTVATLFLATVYALSFAGFVPGWVPVVYLGASAVTFFAYWLDKAAARRTLHRTSEQTLQLFALFGGWPGAWVAQQLFRHKTRKASFQGVFWTCVLLNGLALGWLVWQRLSSH